MFFGKLSIPMAENANKKVTILKKKKKEKLNIGGYRYHRESSELQDMSSEITKATPVVTKL